MASKKDKLLESAQRFLLKGQLDRAIRDYEQVVALEPKEVRHRQKLAELLVRDNRKEEAIAQYEDIGKHYADNSYFLKAIAVYKQIQRLVPNDNSIILTIASLNHKQGLTGNAMAEYGQVLARLEQEGALKEALKVVDQMLAVDAAHAPSRLKQAELLFATGSADASCQAFGSLLAALRAGGDQAAAEKVAARMRELFPDQQEEGLDGIAARISSGAIEGAVASLNDRLKRDKGDLQAWQLLCDAERRRGNTSALREACRQMAGLFPNNPAVLEGAVRCEMEAGDQRQALSLLERHLQIMIDKGGAQAAEELLLALSAAGEDARVKEGLRRVYQATGNRAKLDALQGGEVPSAQAVPAPRPAAAGPASAFGAVADSNEALSAFGEMPFSAPEVPAGQGGTASVKVGEVELDLPWEEEIELDLDDDPHHEAAREVHLSLDFSLPLHPEPLHPEPAAEAARAPAGSGQEESLPDWSDSSPFGELAAPAETEASEPAFAEDLSFLADVADPFAPDAESEPEAAGGSVFELELDEEAPSLELTLPDHDDLFAEPSLQDFSAFREADEPEEVQELEEPREPEHEAAAEAEAFSEIAELPSLPEPQVAWDTIYPDAVAAEAGGLDIVELESHYDLGIGYKEMGMYAAAIREFSTAAANPQRRLDCLTLQSLCYLEKGEPGKAEELLQRGRELTVLSPEERVAVSYHLGVVFENSGAVDDALALYREVYEASPHFHDVAQRLSRLAGVEEPLDVIDLELEESEL